jgi:alpha-2-macroglobulin
MAIVQNKVLGLLVSFWVVLFATIAVSAAEPITLIPGADFAGGDYRTIKKTDLGQCSAVCAGDAKCKAFTFNSKANWCFLKSVADVVLPAQVAVAGRNSAEPVTIATAEAPELSFIDVSVVSAARSFADVLKAGTPPENKDPVALKAEVQAKIAALDFQGAADLAKATITLGDDSYEAWRNLALALNAIQTTDSNLLYVLNQDILNASYIAYLRSVSPVQRGEALSVLGSALVRFGSTRAGIDAYRAATAAYPAPALVAAFEDAKLKYGFRVLDYVVNADAADPRVCVQFSEDLKRGRIDFMPFVTVDGGAPAAVQANGRELCVDGLKRGVRTALTVRDGLPAEIGEKTLKPTTLSVFIRDRSPTVRFTGQNYVLPGGGRHGVPVVSINASEIAVEIYHIPERGLAGFVKGTQFLSQINDQDAGAIAADSGQQVWAGTLAVDVKSNEEVTTSFPLDEALKAREPGVYVMVAKPVGSRAEDWEAKATQWLLVSDLGITTLSNQSGLSVFVRSLNSAKALANTQVALIARNNQVLGKATTNDQGLATFDGGLMRGTGGNAPAIVTVDGADQDFGFIVINRAAYDFSDRGVGGRTAPGPIDVFMYTERGIYRPGHTVHLAALARDDKAVAISGLPMTLIVYRPDGVEYQRYVVQDQGLGSYAIDVSLKTTAMRGMWSVAAHTDVKQDAIASTRFRVDDFVPDRIEFDLASSAQAVALDGPTEATVAARFLYGAPASDLRVEGDIVLTPTRAIAEYPGYQFGLEEKNPTSGRTELNELGNTDEAGNATLSFQPTDIPQTTQPLGAVLNIRVVEGSGRAIERQIALPVALGSGMIGIKPVAAEFAEGDVAQFDVIAIDANKARIASGPLSWELLAVRDDFQWYQKDGRWTYEATEYTDRIANGKTEANGDAPARVEGKLDWGHYRISIESDDPNGPVASYDFYAGWYRPQASSDSPDILQIALDKPRYKVGDTAVVKINPRFAGVALVNVVGQTLIDMKAVDVAVSGGEARFTVTENWGPGTYVTATLFRAASAESKMPGRAIGIMPMARDETNRTLTIALDTPAQMQPRSTLEVPIKIGNIAPGEKAYVTLAGVDVGVLNVTAFTPPDADGWFYGQRRLAMELRDIYGQLINGALGNTGAIRSGGGDEDEAAGLNTKGNPPTAEVVSLFSGIVTVGPDGAARVAFEVPEFNGTLRLMAVAWSQSAIGDASKDVIVRDPIVVSEGLPRFLAPGDTTRLRLDIDNTDGPNGEYSLEVKPSAGLTIAGTQRKIALNKGKRVAVSLPVTADGAGVQTVDVNLTHASGLVITRHMEINVRPGQPVVSSRQIITLQPGQSLPLKPDTLAKEISGTGRLTVAITGSGALDVPGILQSLDRYPYGCTEQTTSRALPLLYLSDVAARAGLAGDTAVKERVQDAIYRTLANQSSEGAFGLWNSYSSGDLWLDSYVTDFLTRAKEEGYDVPQKAFENALANLQNVIAITQTVEEKPSDIAYGLYVLARNKKASIGDLRFYAETKLESFPSPMARAQLAAALALYGDKQRATETMDAAYKALLSRKEEDWLRLDYGSNLRDTAALLALTLESDPTSPLVAKLTAAMVRFQTAARWTSTQEDAWMLLAARGLMRVADAPKITVGGKSFAGDYVQDFTAETLVGAPAIVNGSDRAIDAVLTISGVPTTADPAGGNGFSIERTYYNFDGTAADLGQLKQNDRVVVVLKVGQVNAWPSKIMVTDLLPSGLEIDNPSLVTSASIAALDWLPEAPANAYLEFRDDRFAAALTRDNGDNAEVTYAYVVRAVTPGQFVAPPALVEDMYRPYLNARTDSGVLEVK